MTSLTLSRGQRRQLHLANVSQPALSIPSTSFNLSSALTSLTTHSAEVNIGIIAACLPTLLPLYRLVHDKITSTTGRFYVYNGKFLFGQRPNATNSLQQPTQGNRAEAEGALPQNAQRADSVQRLFSVNGEAEDKDMEMQTPHSGRSSHLNYT